MQAYQDGKIMVFLLESEEFKDPVLKNQLMFNDRSWETIVFCDQIRVGQETIESMIRALEEQNIPLVAYERDDLKNNNGKAENIELGQTITLDMERICGMGWSRQQLCKIGGFHKEFPETDILEYLCRMVRFTSKCQLIYIDGGLKNGAMSVDYLEKQAFTYAYLIRAHMNALREKQQLESAFQSVCGMLATKGILEIFQQYMNFFLTNEKEYKLLARLVAPFVVIRGDDTCGGVLQQFADDLANALEENGQAVYEIGTEKDVINVAELQGIVLKGVVGFQSAALEKSFFSRLNGPKFQFWFDNPFSFRNVLRNLSVDHFILCQDADHADWIREFYHTDNAIQFPPGGIESDYYEGERTMDVVFMGRYFSDDTSQLSSMQKAFYDYMCLHPKLDFKSGAEGYFGRREDLSEVLYNMKPACRAVIGHFRCAVVETILNAGVELHVYGTEWNDYAGTGKENLVIHSEVSMVDSVKEFHKAKIGLNVMSWYKAGMTERVANIMLSGAVCLSDETRYLRERISDQEEIVLYRLDALDMIPNMVIEILRNRDKWQRISKNGYRKAVHKFTWRVKARELIELAEGVDC